MKKLWADLETYCEVPLKNGTYAYAEAAEIMLMTWAFDDDPVSCWDLTAGEPMPVPLAEGLADPEVIIDFQNSMFDRTVMRLGTNVPPLLRAAANDIPRWRDTMIKALSNSLPGALDKTGVIMGLSTEEQKHKDGRALILLFCKPRPVNSVIRRATRLTHPVEWAKFKSYAIADSSAMRLVDQKLPTWNYDGALGSAGEKELALWHLDQKINDRGITVDVTFAQAAIEAAEKEKKRLAKRTMDVTNGEVERTTQRDKLLLHILAEYGVDLPDLQSSTLERRINDPDLPRELRELLDIRMQASMGSSSKYKAMLKAVSSDGRVRGLLQFNGASRTRRWAGRTVQPQNMFRPREYIKKDWEFSVEIVRSGAADLMFDNVMEATASLARGALIAAEGKKLRVADLANIEGRVQAWLAGEAWKLQAFRDYDTVTGKDAKGKPIRKGHDLYKLAYAKAFRILPEEVDDHMRQIGKVLELMLGYGGGVGAFLTGALTYNIDLEAMAEGAYDTIPADVLKEAEGFYDWNVKMRRTTFGLSRKTFVVCDAFKRLWRAAHPNISTLWGEMEAAAREAIARPGNTVVCRMFKFRRDGAWLRMGLPSGRCLCYPSPAVSEKGQISYKGINQYSRQWSRITTYGGKFFENACQALARDVMADNMHRIEACGYEILLGVHDELITETPDTDDFDEHELSMLLATNPPWGVGLPLAAAGWSGYRYRKD